METTTSVSPERRYRLDFEWTFLSKHFMIMQWKTSKSLIYTLLLQVRAALKKVVKINDIWDLPLSVRGPPPPLNWIFFTQFLRHFFLLQFYLTYMKWTFTLGLKSKISVSSPFTIAIFSHVHSHLNYYIYVAISLEVS